MYIREIAHLLQSIKGGASVEKPIRLKSGQKFYKMHRLTQGPRIITSCSIMCCMAALYRNGAFAIQSMSNQMQIRITPTTTFNDTHK